MKIYTLVREQWLPRPVDVVFPFFADPLNLNDMTPRALHFRITTPGPIAMRPGTTIDYRIRLRGVPMRWRTVITAFDPPRSFVDEQTRGPYSRWVHTHTFEARTMDGIPGTHMTDHVSYALPRWLPGPVAALVHRLLVGPDLDRVFTYRREALERRFPNANAAA